MIGTSGCRQSSSVKRTKNRLPSQGCVAQVNPQTVQHARTRDVTSCWRKHTCGVKNNNCSSRRKSRRTVGVIVASPPRDQQGQTAPWLYVTLTTAVRIQHEMYSLMLETCKYS